MSKDKPIQIIYFRWAGAFGPFKVKIPCGECTLTGDIIKDTLDKELAGIPIEVQEFDWLSHWWVPLLRGGWHAPIVMVENRVISQGVALNRGVFIEAVIRAHAERTPIRGNHLFGKENCSFCQKAKQHLDQNAVDYQYHDVIENPKALYEMIARVKPIIGPKTPVTTPQIWLNGEYVGGFNELIKRDSN